MSMSRIAWALGIVLVVGALAVGLSYFAMPEKHILSGSVATDGSWEHVESGEFYHISIKVPRKTSLRRFGGSAADEKARMTMERVFADKAAQFKTESGAEDINLTNEPWMEGRQYEYAVGYAEFTSPHFVSYRFDIYEDAGGAHPNGFYRTFVFDGQGNEVPLSALFVPHSAYLDIISVAARAQVDAEVMHRLGPDASTASAIFADGLSPKAENFQNFVLDGETLKFFIPPYQAAAYAAGTFEVDMPLSDYFKDMLAPNIP